MSTDRESPAADWELVRDELIAGEPTRPAALLSVEHPGLYAWWDRTGELSRLYPTGCPVPATAAPIYVGIARSTLAERVGSMHLASTRMSTFRRSLVTLLYDRLGLIDHLSVARGRLEMDAPGEAILTAWIHEHLEATWVARIQPSEVERSVVGALRPPLNDHYSPSPQRQYLRSARRALRIAQSAP